MKIILSVLLLTWMGGAMHPPSQQASRAPLQKKEIVLEAPKEYAQRMMRDKKTGELIHYDPKPQVVLLDAKLGVYGLRWIGYDGKQKTIVYHRPDTIDAIISASVEMHSSDQYLYTYTVHNLPTSAQNVEGLAVQSFADDVRPLKITDVHIGHMSKTIREMKEGNWLRFAVLGVRPGIVPGGRFEHKLLSAAPPGLVECRAHGITGMKGVGEEPPQELENVLPGYEIWPSGFTVGPVDKLKTFSPKKRAKYLRNRLTQFQQLGWISADSVLWYEQNLRGKNLEAVYSRAEEDFRVGRITTEVFGMITAIRR